MMFLLIFNFFVFFRRQQKSWEEIGGLHYAGLSLTGGKKLEKSTLKISKIQPTYFQFKIMVLRRKLL